MSWSGYDGRGSPDAARFVLGVKLPALMVVTPDIDATRSRWTGPSNFWFSSYLEDK